MKAINLLLSGIIGIASFSSFAQNTSKVWAQITQANAVPAIKADGVLESQDLQLNTAISQINIVGVTKALPSSKNEKLQQVYEFVCNCDENLLRTTLGQISVIKGIENAPQYNVLYTPNDYNLVVPSDYALDLINAEGAWDITHSTTNVVIGISDQNLSPNHSELVGKVVYYDATNVSTPTHGTAVSIIAAGNTDNGDGLSSIGFGSSIAFYQMNYNELLLASYSGLDLINISWTSGCFYNQYEQDVINEVYNNGTFIVAAAGNGNTCGTPDALVYPASYDHVFSVTSIGSADNHEQITGDPTSTHQHNTMVDLSSPGYSVAVSPAEGWYLTSTGTSFAAPFVSGTIALMLSANPCLDNVAIEEILKNSSINIDGLNPNYAGKIGAGRLNAALAVSMAAGYGNPTLFNADILANCSNGGAITINPSNAQSPYNVVWNNGMNGNSNNGLNNGGYTISISDAHGCLTDTTIIIQDATPVLVNAQITEVTCNGSNNGEIDVNVLQGTPSYTYTWDNGSTTEDLSDLGAGTYRLTLVDANGCTSFSSYTIIEPTPIVVTGTIVNEDLNSNGSIDITVIGGVPNYNFIWSNNETTEDITNLNAGIYNVTIVDENGCITNTEFVVEYNGTNQIVEESIDQLHVYPNPSNGETTITWATEMVQVLIFDEQGKMIMNHNTGGIQNLFINQLETGVYILKAINSKGYSVSHRLVIL